ncbi:galactose ABC transporter substrate-binding protein [Clostridium thailandense]|uniref:galactose ABC transporter substrate-binding protein n=1 Tax=Clostridium thailandense TaxID=2794346 RepID=UPI003989A889
MKFRIRLYIVSILILSFVFTGCLNMKASTANLGKKANIGVVVATFDDTWITSVRNQLYNMANDKVNVDIWSADNSEQTQNQKIDLLISRKVDVLAINLVEKSAAAAIIKKAQKANIPVIFFNIEPSAEDLKLWDKVYYVGAKGEQSGEMQGEILSNYFKSHPTKDGIIHYVMLKGPDSHQDAISRSKYSIEAIKASGFKVEKLSEEIAEWNREKADEKMKNILEIQGDKIDCVIANNDDMALGAIDALKDKGYFINGKYIPVVGVDATSAALGCIKTGNLLGTVFNDASSQGKAIFNLANVLANRKSPNKESVGYAIMDNKYIWIDYKVILKENVNDVN